MEITIRETTPADLNNVMDLWNNGTVMFYVGYPDGLGMTLEQMQTWFKRVNLDEYRRHYCIYVEGLGYCGETYYAIDKAHDLATLDIKLLPKTHGKGIAFHALRFVIDHIFTHNLSTRAYVDPHPENKKAWQLYERLGFASRPRPAFLEEFDSYLEVTKDTWQNPPTPLEEISLNQPNA